MKALRVINHEGTPVIKWHNFLKTVRSRTSYNELDLHIIKGDPNAEKHCHVIRNETHVSLEYILKKNSYWSKGVSNQDTIFNLKLWSALKEMSVSNELAFVRESKDLEKYGVRVSAPKDHFKAYRYADY